MMWLMLQQDKPDDYVIATGEQHSVREFVEIAGKHLGLTIKWEGEREKEKGYVSDFNPAKLTRIAAKFGHSPDELSIFDTLQEKQCIIEIDPRYFRPTEVDTLLGNPEKARQQLGWTPQIKFENLVQEMVEQDLVLACKDTLCKNKGFRVCRYNE
jgi:GDPmannose 4,6-dehydratase